MGDVLVKNSCNVQDQSDISHTHTNKKEEERGANGNYNYPTQ